MAAATKSVDAFIENIPSPDEIRTQLAESLRQTRLLRQMLKLAEQRRSVQAVRGKAAQHA